MDRIRVTQVDSTQEWVRRHLGELSSPTCLIADRQTAGHGQYGRVWQSPPGGLYLSLYYSIEPREGLERLAQETALAICGCLTSRGYQCEIQWPNDLMIDGKKVGGVLCEIVSSPKRINVIVGVGINIRMKRELLEQVGQPATALEWCEGELPTRDQLADEVIRCLDLEQR